MGKIFITGDVHRDVDISKFGLANFPEQKTLDKDDVVMVAGDFGMVWDDSSYEKMLRKKLNKRNFTTLFVDGNHENFDLLEKYPVEEWNGGKVQFIENSVIRLMRGQVYVINGIKFFTMGGANSIDKASRRKGISWWEQEMPSTEEMNEGIKNLERHDFKIDIALTHTTSTRIMKKMNFMKDHKTINRYFDFLEKELNYKYWYFGHFHDEITIGKHRLIYDDIIEINKQDYK